jgi:hypothetical protein
MQQKWEERGKKVGEGGAHTAARGDKGSAGRAGKEWLEPRRLGRAAPRGGCGERRRGS